MYVYKAIASQPYWFVPLIRDRPRDLKRRGKALELLLRYAGTIISYPRFVWINSRIRVRINRLPFPHGSYTYAADIKTKRGPDALAEYSAIRLSKWSAANEAHLGFRNDSYATQTFTSPQTFRNLERGKKKQEEIKREESFSRFVWQRKAEREIEKIFAPFNMYKKAENASLFMRQQWPRSPQLRLNFWIFSSLRFYIIYDSALPFCLVSFAPSVLFITTCPDYSYFKRWTSRELFSCPFMI